MAAVLSSAFPEKAPHFFTYLRTITKASRTFESSAWVSYHMAFRRQAANRSSLDWDFVDPALYNEAGLGIYRGAGTAWPIRMHPRSVSTPLRSHMHSQLPPHQL